MAQASPWTNEATVRLKVLIAAGKSYSQAAKILTDEFGRKISRCAVSAKIDRLDLNKPDGPSQPRRLAAPAVKPQGHNPLGNITRAGFGKPAPAETARSASPPDSIALAPLPIHDPCFSHRRCKWPLIGRSEEGDLRLCQNASEGQVYCPDHARYAVTATMPKAARSAEGAQLAANMKANAGANPRALTFSPRAA